MNTVLLNPGVNNLLNSNTPYRIGELLQNLKMVTAKCISLGVEKMESLCGILLNGRITESVVKRCNHVQRKCVYQQ